MGLFSRRKDPDARREKDLAAAVARRGVTAQATIEAMSDTGRTRDDGASREVCFSLRLDTPAGLLQVEVAQFLNDLTLTGLAPGEPATVMYDRDDPTALIVMQSPKYVFVRNPNMAFDGRPMLAVPVADAGSASPPE